MIILSHRPAISGAAGALSSDPAVCGENPLPAEFTAAAVGQRVSAPVYFRPVIAGVYGEHLPDVAPAALRPYRGLSDAHGPRTAARGADTGAVCDAGDGILVHGPPFVHQILQASAAAVLHDD